MFCVSTVSGASSWIPHFFAYMTCQPSGTHAQTQHPRAHTYGCTHLLKSVTQCMRTWYPATLTHSLTHMHVYTLTYTQTRTHKCTHKHTHTIYLAHVFSLTHTHTHSPHTSSLTPRHHHSDCWQSYCCLNFMPLIREIEFRELNGGQIGMLGGLPRDGSYTLGDEMSR